MKQDNNEGLTVEKQYFRDNLYEAILDGLRRKGISEDSVRPEDLSGVDEFHVRGMEVTRELAANAGLSAGTRVLDAGCGLGGPARYLAEQYGCLVTGVDITREYVRTAQQLSKLTGLEGRTTFIAGNVLDLPFAAGYFDAVWTQHVQMNIADKSRFYSELARVLRPGGLLVYYDIFSINHQPVHLPVPWADAPGISHLATLQEFHALLQEAGFAAPDTANQSDEAIHFFNNLLQKMKKGNLQPVSLRLLMGDAIREKQDNLLRNLVEERITLESGICRKIG